MKREISASRVRISTHAFEQGENVVERLHQRIKDIRDAGTIVRTDWLDGQSSSWCELRGIRTIILDASQSAAEQLGQLEEIIQEISQITSPSKNRDAQSPRTSRAA